MHPSIRTFALAAVASSVLAAPTWTAAYAQANFTPPANCGYGRQTADFDLSSLAGFIEINGTDIGLPEDHTDAVLGVLAAAVESFDYLRIESSKYVLRDHEFRVKGNLFDILRYVRFHNSELGFVGRDKSNLEANAYLYMKFPQTLGPAVVWITGNNMCSMESVYVQEPPRILDVDAEGFQNRINVALDYEVHEWSRAARDATVRPRVTFRLHSDTFGNTETISFNALNTSGTQNFAVFPTAGGGAYRVWVTLDDGTYSTTQYLGYQFVTGPHVPPCQMCNPL